MTFNPDPGAPGPLAFYSEVSVASVEATGGNRHLNLVSSGTGVVKANNVPVVTTANFVTRETPTGAVNGTNTSFVLANTPVTGSEQVFLNGILQEPGSGNDYTISVATITYLTAPVTGDKVRVNYIK
jgi:hypothetical protein